MTRKARARAHAEKAPKKTAKKDSKKAPKGHQTGTKRHQKGTKKAKKHQKGTKNAHQKHQKTPFYLIQPLPACRGATALAEPCLRMVQPAQRRPRLTATKYQIYAPDASWTAPTPYPTLQTPLSPARDHRTTSTGTRSCQGAPPQDEKSHPGAVPGNSRVGQKHSGPDFGNPRLHRGGGM